MGDFIERIQFLSEEYNVPKEKILEYFIILTNYEFIDLDDERLYECLEGIVSDMSNTNNNANTDYAKDFKSEVDAISDALYKTYGDEVIKYLNRKYVEQNGNRFGLR